MLGFFFKILFRALLGLSLITIIGVGIFDFYYASDGYQGSISNHFDGKRFHNITRDRVAGMTFEEKAVDFFAWLGAKRPHWTNLTITPTVPDKYYSGSGVKITAVGHATFLIQIAGINILTDPIWTSSPSPFGGISHGRYVNPGISFSDLPPIDAILISHNHYDHLDLLTLKALYNRDTPAIYSGLGNSAYLDKYSITGSIDMEWYHRTTLSGGVEITFVPAQHYSARAITDRNATLWGGFVIAGVGKTLYFAGDTGYGDFINNISQNYPSGFDIGLLPVGAYHPDFIMKKYHMNPREALMAQSELKIQSVLGMHWGTFALGSDGQNEPLQDFEIAKADFPYADFRLTRPGDEWIFQ